MRQLGRGGFSAYLRRSRQRAVAVQAVTAPQLVIIEVIGEKSAEVIVVGIKQVGESSLTRLNDETRGSHNPTKD